MGMSVANRTRPELEGLIGFFVNILPVRIRFDQTMELDELIARVSHTVTDALDHQDYPFDLMVQRLNPSRAATRQPIVNVVYAFQNFNDLQVTNPPPGHSPAGATRLTPMPFEVGTSKFDLTLFVSEEEDGLRLTLEYDSGVFVEASATRYLEVLTRFARTAARTDETS